LKPNNQKVLLVILDGFGINPNENEIGNAIKEAKTPNLDKLFKEYPSSQIHTSGKHVGLPDGQMGNSEVGHLNIGAGRIVYSDIVRISKGLNYKTLKKNSEFINLISYLKKSGGRLHLMGLLSDGGVHSLQEHLHKLLLLLKENYSEINTYIHAFLDGRDTAPKSAIHFVNELIEYTKSIKYASLATIIGRYYAMDRDNRWERTEKAYALLSEGSGMFYTNAEEAIQNAYENNETDEFMHSILTDEKGIIKDKDAILFFNFRADRARQITRAFTEKNFSEFQKNKNLDIHFVCMTQYHEDFNLPVLFKPISMNNLLGEVISKNNLKQLRISETEKYAHITFFFNGGIDTPFQGEDRKLIPSPDVSTYDLQPEMSAYEIKDKTIKALKTRNYDLIVLNFANGDMVGHTGIFKAAVTAVETLDICVGEIVKEALKNEYSILITADHGNCEKMLADDKTTPFTQHTTFNTPLLLIDNHFTNKKIKLTNGRLCDIAPTILKIMGISIPKGENGMTGEVLIDKPQ